MSSFLGTAETPAGAAGAGKNIICKIPFLAHGIHH